MKNYNKIKILGEISLIVCKIDTKREVFATFKTNKQSFRYLPSVVHNSLLKNTFIVLIYIAIFAPKLIIPK